jgi:hypothetical protein
VYWFDVFSLISFVPFDIFSARRVFEWTFFYSQPYFQSMFFTFRHFVPVGIFSIRRFVPFGVFSFDILSVDIFYRWRYLIWRFVGESTYREIRSKWIFLLGIVAVPVFRCGAFWHELESRRLISHGTSGFKSGTLVYIFCIVFVSVDCQQLTRTGAKSAIQSTGCNDFISTACMCSMTQGT